MEKIYKEALCKFCHINEIILGIKENNTQDFKELEELIYEAKIAKKELKYYHIETFKKIKKTYGKLEALQWKQEADYIELLKTINDTIENLYQKVYIIGKNKVKSIVYYVESGKITKEKGCLELSRIKSTLKSILKSYTYFVQFLAEKTDTGTSFYDILIEV